MNKDTKKCADLSKEKRISDEFDRIYSMCKKQMDDDHLLLALKTIQNCAFMAVTMEDLQEIINKEPFVEEWTNGKNQGGQRSNTHVVIYSTFIKNYNSCIKTLDGMIASNTSGSGKNDPSGLADFMMRKK